MRSLFMQRPLRRRGRGIAIVTALGILLLGATASARGVNNLMAGINGLATFPFDPIASTVEPPEAFEGMFGAPVTPVVVGFFQGTLMSVYRASMGVLDIAFFPFWVFPTLSPEPRYDLFNYYDVEYE